MNTLIEGLDSGEIQKLYFIVGAGASVSAGLPDFRSEQGLYANLDKLGFSFSKPPHMFNSYYYNLDPTAFLTLAPSLWPGAANKFGEAVTPTAFHFLLAALDKLGKLEFVITQNIDSLEAEAGLSEDKYLAAHGDFRSSVCSRCKTNFTPSYFRSTTLDFANTGSCLPTCPFCGGFYKPSIIFFHETLSDDFFIQKENVPHLTNTALVIVGSSDLVYPVCDIKKIFPGKVFYVNPDATNITNKAMSDIRGLSAFAINEYADVFAKELAAHLSIDLELMKSAYSTTTSQPRIYRTLNMKPHTVLLDLPKELVPVPSYRVPFMGSTYAVVFCTDEQLFFWEQTFKLVRINHETGNPILKVKADLGIKGSAPIVILQKTSDSQPLIDFYMKRYQAIVSVNTIDSISIEFLSSNYAYATDNFARRPVSKSLLYNLFTPHYSSLIVGYYQSNKMPYIAKEITPFYAGDSIYIYLDTNFKVFLRRIPEPLLSILSYRFFTLPMSPCFFIQLSGNSDYFCHFTDFLDVNRFCYKIVSAEELDTLYTTTPRIPTTIPSPYSKPMPDVRLLARKLVNIIDAKIRLLNLYQKGAELQEKLYKEDPMRTRRMTPATAKYIEEVNITRKKISSDLQLTYREIDKAPIKAMIAQEFQDKSLAPLMSQCEDALDGITFLDNMASTVHTIMRINSIDMVNTICEHLKSI